MIVICDFYPCIPYSDNSKPQPSCNISQSVHSVPLPLSTVSVELSRLMVCKNPTESLSQSFIPLGLPSAASEVIQANQAQRDSSFRMMVPFDSNRHLYRRLSESVVTKFKDIFPPLILHLCHDSPSVNHSPLSINCPLSLLSVESMPEALASAKYSASQTPS